MWCGAGAQISRGASADRQGLVLQVAWEARVDV